MNLARWRDVWRRFHGRGTYPQELAFLLDLSLRNFILSAPALANRLHLRPDSRVLEVGPGPGFFSVEIAGAVPAGRLELFDIQREMLAKARAKLRRAERANTGFTQGSAECLPFKPDVFDVAFLVAVLGEVPDPSACIAWIRVVLRPGGLLSITELPGDPDALTEPAVRELATRNGFEFTETFPVRRGFTVNFRKVVMSAEPSIRR